MKNKLVELKVGTKLKVTKIAPVKNPRCPTPAFKDYTPGEDNGDVSLPIEYWMEGKLSERLKEGGYLSLDRSSRNGVVCDGYFCSTYITAIDEDNKTISTVNSVYKIETI